MFSRLAEQGLRRHWVWLLLGLTLLFVGVVRVCLLDMPLERDEGEYAYAGQLLLHGVAPYQQVYAMKLPGTYAAYALIMAVFGQTPAGIHLGLLLVNLISIVFLFLIGRRLLDDTTGLVAAASFALLSLSPTVSGLAAHATHFIVLFALAGIWVLLRLEPKGSSPKAAVPGSVVSGQWSMVHGQWSVFSSLFFAGFLLGLAFLMKQHGFFFVLFGILFFLWARVQDWRSWCSEQIAINRGKMPVTLSSRPVAASAVSPQPRLNAIAAKKRTAAHDHPTATSPITSIEDSPNQRFADSSNESPTDTPTNRSTDVPKHRDTDSPTKPPSPASFFRLTALLALGSALPFLLTCLAMLACGCFDKFFFWTVTYAAKYASAVPLANAPALLKTMVAVVIGPNAVFWILPIVGAFVMWFDPRLLPRNRFFLMALLFCSLASISVGLYFREHYFITLLPVLALLSAVAVSRSAHLLRHGVGLEPAFGGSVLLLFVIAVGATLIGSGAFWFGMSPTQFVRNSYLTTLFSDTLRTAEYIRDNSDPQARIAVLGSEPQICFYAKRRSATGHIYMYPLLERHQYAAKMQDELMADIERVRPEFVVRVDDPYSWSTGFHQPEATRRLSDWWNAWWPTNMDLVNQFEVTPGEEQHEVRSGEKPAQPEATPSQILVYRRKTP